MARTDVRAPDAVHDIVEMLSEVSYDDLPADATLLAKQAILDTIGVSVAAMGTATVARKVVEVALEQGGREESTVISDGRKVPAPMAALANATLAHALNYDDSSDPLMTHFSCIISPAGFAVAEREGGVSGKEFLAAYVLSMDVAGRLSRAVIVEGEQPNWNLHGWLMTQLVGYFSAAAMSSRLMRFDKDRTLNALGLAYAQVAGNKQALIGGGADKGIYPSFPAHAGVMAAIMADKGLRGATDVLEGRNGFYNVFFGGIYNRRALTDNLGVAYEKVGFYPYPCCGFTHPRIELAMRMVKEHRIAPGDIDSIIVYVGPISRGLCEPLDLRREPKSMGDAQYSLPFTVASAIVRGGPSVDHFTDDGLVDPDTLRLAHRINYRLDDKYDQAYGSGHCPAKLDILLTDGQLLTGEQDGARYGHPDRPVTSVDLIAKFRDCLGHSPRALPADTPDRVISLVDSLEDSEDVTELVRLVS